MLREVLPAKTLVGDQVAAPLLELLAKTCLAFEPYARILGYGPCGQENWGRTMFKIEAKPPVGGETPSLAVYLGTPSRRVCLRQGAGSLTLTKGWSELVRITPAVAPNGPMRPAQTVICRQSAKGAGMAYLDLHLTIPAALDALTACIAGATGCSVKFQPRSAIAG